MPFDEHGVKWSCEPCIRGHRSSKCAHFDRLMVSVGKAGRPLSKCPHVEGSCNCKKLGAFMVAIPKDSGCLCRPVYKMLLDENGPTPAASRLPVDLTATATASASAGSASPSPNKIQKNSKKQVKTAPEQISRALNSIPEYNQQGYQYGAPPMMGPYQPHAQMAGYPYNHVNGFYPHPNAFPMATNFPNGLGISGSGLASPRNGLAMGAFHPNVYQSPMQPMQPIAPMPAQTQGSCCSTSRPESSNEAETDNSTIYQSPIPTTAPMPAQKQGSCCSRSRESTNDIKPETSNTVSNDRTVSSVTGSPVTSSSSSNLQEFSNINGHLSPMKGTSNGLPDLSAFDLQVPPKTTNSATVDSEQVLVSQADLVTASDAAQPSYTAHTSGVPHSCSCGPNCNCFACPDHPYNDITVRHVQEMGRIITQDSETSGHGSNQSTPVNTFQTDESQLSQPFAEPNNQLENSFNPISTGQCCDTDHSLEDQNDTQAFNTLAADHLMLPDAYYTYEYEFGLPGACAGEAGNCQCGPTCSCLGCLTHGNF